MTNYYWINKSHGVIILITIIEIYDWPKCREQLTRSPNQWIHLQCNSYTEGSGNIIEERNRKIVSVRGHYVCCEIMFIYNRGAEPMKSQKYCPLNYTQITTTPVDKAAWMGKISQCLILKWEPKAANGCWGDKSVPLGKRHPW